MKTLLRLLLLLPLLIANSIVITHQSSAQGSILTSSSVISSPSSAQPWWSQYIERDLERPLNVGNYVSIAFRPFDMMPYISYYDQNAGDVVVATRSSPGEGNCAGNANWLCVTVDSNGDVGQYTSIDVWGSSWDNWKYAISYHDVTNRALKAAIFECAPSCTSYFVSILLPESSSGTEGLYTSLRFTSFGMPAFTSVTYDTLDVEKLWYVFPMMDGSGNCGEGPDKNMWQCDLIRSSEDVGMYASLDFSYNDVPYISYRDGTQHSLDLAYYTGDWTGNCAPLNSWTCQQLDYGADDPGYYTSVSAPQFDGDVVRVAYYDAASGYLKYYDPNSGASNLDFMGTSPEPMGIAMVVDQLGFPVIAYQQADEDFSLRKLRIASLNTVYGDSSEANCGMDSKWHCSTLDNGNQYAKEANFVALAVGPSDLLYIAYPEYDEYYDATSLKLMYQYDPSYVPMLLK